MTFKEAKIKLAEVAEGKYRSLQYYENNPSEGPGNCICHFYIDGEGWYQGKTWADAFKNREEAVNPKPFTEEGQPE